MVHASDNAACMPLPLPQADLRECSDQDEVQRPGATKKCWLI
jgi:hypothetical protein